MTCERLTREFYIRDVLEVAPALLGLTLARKYADGSVARFTITETEAYRGTEDLACHASRGRSARTDVMFREGGLVYVYFVYGMHWMLNIVTGKEGDASAVLIRGLDKTSGPGRVGRILQIDKSLYGANLVTGTDIWIEDSPSGRQDMITLPRVGIAYAGEPWVSMPWRFRMTGPPSLPDKPVE